jgi:hypothetical protein
MIAISDTKMSFEVLLVPDVALRGRKITERRDRMLQLPLGMAARQSSSRWGTEEPPVATS